MDEQGNPERGRTHPHKHPQPHTHTRRKQGWRNIDSTQTELKFGKPKSELEMELLRDVKGNKKDF